MEIYPPYLNQNACELEQLCTRYSSVQSGEIIKEQKHLTVINFIITYFGLVQKIPSDI